MRPSFEDAPEALHDLVVGRAALVRRDRLEALHVDLARATGSNFDSFGSKVRNESQIALEDLIETLLDSLDLLLSLREACLEDEADELIDALLGHLAILAVLLQFDLVSIRQNCGEVLVNSCRKVLI